MVATRQYFTQVTITPGRPENTLVIVGTALDGPSHSPFMLDVDDAKQVLGDCPLSDAYEAARDAGAEDIILYRLNGKHSESIIRCVTPTLSQDVIRLRSVSANDIYNEIQVTVYPTHIFFHETSYRPERSYFFRDFKTMGALVYRMNQDAEFGLLEVSAELIDNFFNIGNFSSMTEPLDTVFRGGETGINLIHMRDEDHSLSMEVVTQLRAQLKDALFGPFEQDQLEMTSSSDIGLLDFGVITLADIFHDEDQEVANILGTFCLNKSKDLNQNCIAVLGTAPLIDKSDEAVDAMRQNLLSLSETQGDSKSRDYVQIIVGQRLSRMKDKSIPTSYSYAGAQASYPYHMMLTNKRIAGIDELEYKMLKEDVETLTSNGYTCIVPSVRRGHVPYSAVTYTRNIESSFKRPHCMRVSHQVSKVLSEELDYLIGSVSTFISTKDVTDRVSDILAEFVAEQVIASYEASCEFSNQNTEIKLDVAIRPFSEVRSVNSIVTLSVPGRVIR